MAKHEHLKTFEGGRATEDMQEFLKIAKIIDPDCPLKREIVFVDWKNHTIKYTSELLKEGKA